jgi:glucosamine--fructose-6-phosphate aminotransferase (isomerizing)
VSTRDEILEQPAVVDRLVREQRRALPALVDHLRRQRIEHVVIAARGTSDHAAVYAQYVLGARNRLPVALAAPSIVSLYGVAPRFERSLVIGISQSGASPDVIGVVVAAREQGQPTLAITNDPGSELASAADAIIDLAAGPERGLAATKTYTAELAAIATLSAALLDDETAWDDLARAPDQMALALASEGAARSAADRRATLDRCVVLGRGYDYATAREWALKLKELAYVMADPYSSADFQHGPVALVEPGFAVLAVVPRGVPAAGLRELLERLRGRGADLVVVSDDPATLAAADDGLAVPGGLAEWLMPLVDVVPAQWFALALTEAKGLDPESPRNLHKVTRTT